MQYVIASGIFEQIIQRHKGLLKIKEGRKDAFFLNSIFRASD